MITGRAGSEVKVSCNTALVLAAPSVIVSVIEKLPSEVGVPEIKLRTESTVRPGGRALVLSRAAEVAPLVRT